MRRLTQLLIVLVWALSAPCSYSDEMPQKVDDIYKRLQTLLVEYYPKAAVERKAGSFQCRFNTRIFMIHHPLKTGEWQEARPQEGPNRGGILCTIESSRGPYAGAACTPQTFEYRYFKSLLMAPCNKSTNTHLIAHLDFPDNVPPTLLERYRTLIDSFEDGTVKRKTSKTSTD